jgi:iron complex transport system ATP-binding protein
MSDVALTASGIGVQIRSRWLLRDVDFAVQPGEVVALVGPNGAGKSTLLRVLAGDLQPTTGTVTIGGRPLAGTKPRDLALLRAVLPQQTILQFAFTAREVVEMGRGPREGDDDLAVIEGSMLRTESLHMGERIFPSLSGGEQSRVSLARVLAQEAPLLLLDEPTASLDLRHQDMVMTVARELAGEGLAVVAVLHDLNLAAAHADRIAILSEGRLIKDAPPWEALEESLLSDVFECRLAVTTHPVRGCPWVMTLPAVTNGTPRATPLLSSLQS